MKHLDDIELHDALIHRAEIDYPKQTIRVEIEFYPSPQVYPSPQAPKRKRGVIAFDGVRSISHTADLVHIKRNAFAGTINYWAPAKKDGVTFIYLVNGVISVTAKKVSFKGA